MERKRLTCEQVREIDIVAWLARLGFEPAKIRGNDFWYCSPFRNERTPSLKVNRSLNRWYDFGEGIGGSIIDFGIRYMDCTIGEFVSLMSDDEQHSYSFFSPAPSYAAERHTRVVITKVRPVFSRGLLRYLLERRISVPIADRFLKEITYTNHGKQYYALGFENDKGGYELRSAYFKGSNAPKYYTHIKCGSNTLSVFEGFMDFLSFLAIAEMSGIPSEHDFLILNSLSFVAPAIGRMNRYSNVQLFLDNDKAGDKQTLIIKSQIAQAEDHRILYKDHKDLNEFLCYPGTPRSQPP